jgi:hypothetical protein
MKTIKSIVSSVCLVVASVFSQHAAAQFMPVVFDNNYGKENQFTTAAGDFQNGDVVVAGSNGGNVILTWLDREGVARFSTRFLPSEFSQITSVTAIADDQVLVTGSRTAGSRETNTATGRAMVIDSTGAVLRAVAVGSPGAVVTSGRVLPGGNMFLAGSNKTSDGRHGMICKVNPQNRVVYTYVAATGEVCCDFNVHGSRTEYVNAAFTGVDKAGSSVVRLDDTGKPFFITVMPDPGFVIEKMYAGSENDLFLVGQGPQAGGQVIKVRNEGDIVFQRQIIPASPNTRLSHLMICPAGELLVGGNDRSAAYFSLLRNDGTVLSTNTGDGEVSAMAVCGFTSDCLVSTFNPVAGKGRIVKMSKQGHRLYDKVTAANYNAMFINTNGDLLIGSPQTGRLSMLSNLGELLFDRYVVENTPTNFNNVYLPSTGEAIFLGADSRVAKLAHGVYVSDIMVGEPIDGHVSAIFTVTVSGYSFSKEGSPLPVSLNYKTNPISAVEGVNFVPVSGTISFVPSGDGSDRYLNKFTVEVPINANNLLEGERTFTLDLSDVRHSYLIKSSSLATITDQPAIVKPIEVLAGLEGSKDVIYKLGIFKRNETPLINKTRSDIVIDGVYGEGSADKLDYNTGRMPRLVIAPETSSGVFNVETLEDTRYEAIKTVVLNWNTVHAMSDTHVSFGASHISCQGEIHDQAALVTIESLGDRIKRTNDVVNGLFKISLVSAKTGALLTNDSGADIVLGTQLDEGGSAVQGTDFVITNGHALRIAGDGRSSTVNLNGLVLYTADPGAKRVAVNLRDVKAGEHAGPISIATGKRSAAFTIRNN